MANGSKVTGDQLRFLEQFKIYDWDNDGSITIAEQKYPTGAEKLKQLASLVKFDSNTDRLSLDGGDIEAIQIHPQFKYNPIWGGKPDTDSTAELKKTYGGKIPARIHSDLLQLLPKYEYQSNEGGPLTPFDSLRRMMDAGGDKADAAEKIVRALQFLYPDQIDRQATDFTEGLAILCSNVLLKRAGEEGAIVRIIIGPDVVRGLLKEVEAKFKLIESNSNVVPRQKVTSK